LAGYQNCQFWYLVFLISLTHGVATLLEGDTMSKPKKKYLRKKAVAERYSVSNRTIERWSSVKVGILPPPMYLPGVEFPLWSEDVLDAHDRKVARASHPH
jgi:hypothetical protein